MDSSDTTASQQSSRQSTLIYTTDITFISTAILDPHPSINSSSSEDFSSPEVTSSPSLPTKGHNKTLKPLSYSNNSNDNRSSIGYWSGTKTAASTPNLMNPSKNSDFFGSYPLQGSASGKGAMTTPSTPTTPTMPSIPPLTPTGLSPSSPKPGFGGRLRSGSMSASASGSRSTPCGQGVASSGSSIHHRRKRSESIGGIKSTAGNITRMVRKSSSSFLRKFAKSFDDKDAPPIPVLPSHNNNSTVSHQSESSVSITNSIVSTTATTPLVSSDLSILSEKRSSGLVGPLDMLPVDDEDDMESSIHTDSPVSPTGAHHKQQHQEHLLHPGFAGTTRPISIPRPLSRTSGLDIEVDEELSNSVSTVESWLRKTRSDQEEASARASSPSTSTAITTTATATITTATTTTTTATGDLNDATTIAELATHSSFSPTNLTKHLEAMPVPLTTAAKFSLLAQTIRRPSHASSVSTMDDDSEGEDMPIPIQSVLITTLNSNRLSRLFEATGSPISLQPYYSTKAALSLSEGEPQQQDSSQGERCVSNGTINGNRGSRMSLVADFRNSIRFSEFGLMAPNKDLPSIPDSSLPIEKPLPHRPISLLAPLGTLAFTMLDSARDDEGGGVDNRSRTPASSGHVSPALLCLSPDTSPTESYPGQGSTAAAGSNRLEIPRNTTAGGNGARPATICIGAEDSQQTAQVPGAISVLFIPLTMDTQPVEEQREETTESLAQQTSRRCFQEDESFLRRDEISIYLGQAKSFNQLVLRYYMSNFDFSGKRVDVAFRQLCQKLMLRGETQEVDRVLESFAERYVDCNPESIFGSKDVVHAVTYSILLLNTDLHVVQQSSANKMSRSAFVKNTLQAVKAQTLQQQEDDERVSEDSSTHGLPFTRTTTGDSSLPGSGGKKRTPSIKSWRSGTSFQNRNSKMGADPKANGGHGNGKWWMGELETLLKDIYSTVKNNQILLPTTTPTTTPTKPTSKSAPNTPVLSALPQSTSTTSLSSTRSATGGSSFLTRLPKPETPPAGSGNFGGSGNNSGGSIFSALGRRSSMNFKSKQRLNAQAVVEAASSASPPLPSPPRFGYVEDGSGTAPQGCSRPGNSSHGPAPTLTPPSSFISQRSQMASSPLPSPVSNVFLHQDTQGCSSPNSSSGLQQESKFRMEGYLFRKHLLERTDKKASHRTWRRLLVVLDQGGLWMFRADGQTGQGYEEQVVLFDEIRLQHTITNILPPPGYSSSRRHVFAVQLHSGAVYLFQTASSDECEQWARNCNYWAARTSKEPLSGGVINMDYGWGRCLDLVANSPEPAHSNTMSSTTSGYSISSLSSGSAPYSSSSNVSTPMTPPSSGRSTTTSDDNDTSSAQTGTGYLSTPPPPPLSSSSTSSFSSAIQAYPAMVGAETVASVNSGGRASSMKSTTSRHGGGAGMPMSPGDRVTLFEWTPPLPTMSMSSLGEEEQCKSLKRYVAGLEADMEVHQDHRIPMTRLFQPRTPNFVKAFNNWERRSRYLLKDMVKYQIYVECLEQSIRHQRMDQEDGTEDLDTELQHLEVDDDDDDYHRQHHHDDHNHDHHHYTHTHDKGGRDV